MAYQFAHLESFSRKADDRGRSTSFVFDEAGRKPIACVHVPDPRPPIVIYGVGIEEVRRMHDAAAAIAMTPGPRGKSRKIRLDQKTLHTVVASHPFTVNEVRTDRAKFEEVRAWEKLTVEWLRKQYGQALKSVVRHTDEKQWHIHAYILPTSDPEMRASVFHPGVFAKKAVKAAGRRSGEDAKALNKRADVAYKAAMREWQDSYHQMVAIPCGLTRLGPARRRLTREEWKAEQAQARALKLAAERARVVEAGTRNLINRTQAETAAMQADAKRAVAAADRLRGWGGAVRSLVEGVRASTIRLEIRREFARDIAAAQAAADKARADAERERAARRQSELSADNARTAARRAAAGLAATQAEVRRLSEALAVALDEPAPQSGRMTP